MAARDPGDEKRSRLTVPSERGTTRGLTALNRLAVRGSFIFNQKIIAESKIKLSNTGQSFSALLSNGLRSKEPSTIDKPPNW